MTDADLRTLGMTERQLRAIPIWGKFIGQIVDIVGNSYPAVAKEGPLPLLYAALVNTVVPSAVDSLAEGPEVTEKCLQIGNDAFRRIVVELREAFGPPRGFIPPVELARRPTR